jgi:hypothetical protein
MSSILKCESFGYKVNLTREDDIEKWNLNSFIF